MAPSKLEAPLAPQPLQAEDGGSQSKANAALHDRRFGSRLLTAGLISLAVNLLLWRVASDVAHSHVKTSSPPIVITRIILPAHQPKVIPHPKKVNPPKPKPIPPRPKPKLTMPPPKPTPHLQPQKTVVHLRQQPTHHAPPPTAHNRVLTAKPDKTTPAPHDHTALPNGNAKLGAPIAQQNPGTAVSNPPKHVPETPKPQPEQTPIKPEPQPAPPQPKPEPPPAPTGPTQDAQPTDQAQPEIPDELKQEDFKTYVRVRVEVEPDGNFTVTLRSSSGNEEIDQRVLDALKKWRWKPALRDGVPVRSTQLFKFEFQVN